MNYRKDIDGLRAIAIGSVVLYHAGVKAASGGFVGVDIFFVISGFLITRLICEDIARGRFSLASFYERRVRRIFPALFVMLAVVSVASFFILLPLEFKRFGASQIALLFFASNFYFWKRVENIGYFDNMAHHFPLLHTWSLSVEEQFYLFFPLLLMVMLRRSRRCAIAVTLLCMIVSFLLSWWYLGHDANGAFYFSPARAWELLIGALCAQVAMPSAWPRRLREVLSALALTLMVVPIFDFTLDTPFPGPNALFPVLGSALWIWANDSAATRLGTALGLAPLRLLGKISYSLYLWHWPVIILAQYRLMRPLDGGEMAAAVAVSVLLSALSYRYVEQPVRSRAFITGNRRLVLASAGAWIPALLFGAYTQIDGGIARRGLPQATDLNRHFRQSIGLYDDGCTLSVKGGEPPKDSCLLNGAMPRRVAVWGDSHAAALLPGFVDAGKETGTAVLYFGKLACVPAPGLVLGAPRSLLYAGHTNHCEAFNAQVERYLLEDSAVSTVILVARWAMYFHQNQGKTGHVDIPWIQAFLEPDNRPMRVERSRKAMADSLQRLIARLQAAGKRVAIVYPVPEIGYDARHTIAKMLMYGGDPASIDLPVAAYEQREKEVIALLDGLGSDIIRIRPETLLCDGSVCHASRQGIPLYDDGNHLSLAGNALMQPLLAAALRN